jgi:hypothetical protein
VVGMTELREAMFAELSAYPHVLQYVERLDVDYGETEGREVASIGDANVYTSELADRPGWHTVAIDLDVPAQLVPSSTPGHSHLFIDTVMPWGQYRALLAALAAAGVIEDGYEGASVARQNTAVRLPWVKKESNA